MKTPRPCLLLPALLLVALSAAAGAQTGVTAWHAAGQTWVVWDETPPAPTTYEIWASPTDFTLSGSVAGGALVGRLLPEDWRGARLKIALPGTTYTVPGPGGGGTYTLGLTQGLFVHTAHDATPLYFAVVKLGDTAVGATNSDGPVAPTLVTPTAHFQGAGTHGSGQNYRVYVNWVDGNDDHTSGRPGYPVMGNAGMHGIGVLVVLTEPANGVPASDAAAVVGLHGGGGHFMNFAPGSEMGLSFDDAWLISPDGTINSAGGNIGASWLGYWEGFDRFTFPFAHPVPDGSLVVDYLTRRLMWQLDWLIATFPIDTDRLSVVGHSSGARGAGLVTRAYPERWAGTHQYSSHLETAELNAAIGDLAQDLPTTLPGSPGVASIYDESAVLSPTERDLPFGRFVIGTNDTVGTAAWEEQQVLAYHEVDDSRHGRHLFWDERPHGTSLWPGAYYQGSTLLDSASLLAERVDRSYPAVHGFDQDPATPGQQPFMGAGDPPVGGDPWGTFGGHVGWERGTITDTPHEWACTLFLIALSPEPKDNFPGTSGTASIAIRRPQGFLPAAGTGFHWRLVRVADQALLQAGTGVVEADGLVDVPDLELFPDPTRVRLHVYANPQAQPYGAACAGTGGFEPSLRIEGTPTPGGSFDVYVEGGAGGAPSLLLVGGAPAAIPIGGGCALNVAPLLGTLGPFPLVGAGAGQGRFHLPVALAAGTAPTSLALQAVVLDPGAPLGLAGSAGLAVDIVP